MRRSLSFIQILISLDELCAETWLAHCAESACRFVKKSPPLLWEFINYATRKVGERCEFVYFFLPLPLVWELLQVNSFTPAQTPPPGTPAHPHITGGRQQTQRSKRAMAADADDPLAGLFSGPLVSRRSHLPAGGTWPLDVSDGAAEKQPLPADLIWFHHGTHCRALLPICILSPAREKVSAGKRCFLLHNTRLKPRPSPQVIGDDCFLFTAVVKIYNSSCRGVIRGGSDHSTHLASLSSCLPNQSKSLRVSGGVVFFNQLYHPFRI